tara:strand:+ start:308 stop:913 length:606 start_codon:yes stop_codon:yes gene_type:complete
MKVRDINENEVSVGAQTGRGYYNSYHSTFPVMGFRHDGQIYVLSAKLLVDYDTDIVYDTTTCKLHTRRRLTIYNDDGVQTKTGWRRKPVTDIDVIRRIVADKLGVPFANRGDIEIVGIKVNSSDKLSESHAGWKRLGHMPIVTYDGYYNLDDEKYIIQRTGTWPMPKHLLDRCTITETISNTNEEIDDISKLGSVINVEMI